MTSSLFAWQRAVIASELSKDLQVTALRIGLDSTQATGRDVVINASAVAADVCASERTVWRRVGLLVAGGWLVQTSKPTYTGAATGGRRARYQLLIPGESCATGTCGKSHDSTQSCDTRSCGLSDDSAHSQAIAPLGVAHDSPSRVPNRPQSSDTSTVGVGTLSASDGISSSSSSDVVIDILASKLRRYTVLATIRTDKLRPDQRAELVELIATHGDQRLVDHAMKTVRRDDPPQTIQAFLPGWRVMPRRGDPHLAVVPEPCPEPGHSGTTKHCPQCASEQRSVSEDVQIQRKKGIR